ncbi:hypothetical protein EEB14_51095 [Rhodococcus sp. WS4]|nr:hypothetical protein EEB14_51095 [Rhodococcus sp. WS4]
MRCHETLACAAGVIRLTVDAGTALISMTIAVPVAFAIGEGTAMGRAARGQIPVTSLLLDPKSHDVGMIVTHK